MQEAKRIAVDTIAIDGPNMGSRLRGIQSFGISESIQYNRDFRIISPPTF